MTGLGADDHARFVAGLRPALGFFAAFFAAGFFGAAGFFAAGFFAAELRRSPRTRGEH